MISLCCTRVVRDRLRLSGPWLSPEQPTASLGNWYVHLGRFGHRQIVLATSEHSLLTVLLPARALRESIQASFQAAVAELLTALQVQPHLVTRELEALQPISFATASNRRVIGSMNEFVWQLRSYLSGTSDPLELSLQLSETPMSAVGSRSSYGIPREVAQELLMGWKH